MNVLVFLENVGCSAGARIHTGLLTVLPNADCEDLCQLGRNVVQFADYTVCLHKLTGIY
jgi:hypothetical protein